MLRNAEALRASLSRFRWPEAWPERPEGLTHEDRELAECAQRRERGEKLSREDLEQLNLLGAWHVAVRGLEVQAMGRLRTLLGGIYTFELEGHHEQGSELREFVRQQYRCHVPDPCPVPHYDQARRFADYFGRNLSLFPQWLRAQVAPPEGKGYVRQAPVQKRFTYGYAEDD